MPGGVSGAARRRAGGFLAHLGEDVPGGGHPRPPAARRGHGLSTRRGALAGPCGDDRDQHVVVPHHHRQQVGGVPARRWHLQRGEGAAAEPGQLDQRRLGQVGGPGRVRLQPGWPAGRRPSRRRWRCRCRWPARWARRPARSLPAPGKWAWRPASRCTGSARCRRATAGRPCAGLPGRYWFSVAAVTAVQAFGTVVNSPRLERGDQVGGRGRGAGAVEELIPDPGRR